MRGTGSRPGRRGLGIVSADVRALSTNLTRGLGGPGVSVILTTSNGFLANLYVRGLLLQAATGYMLLEGLKPGDFRSFIREYGDRMGGCTLDHGILEAVSGRLPGVAVELCHLTRDDLTEWVSERLRAMEAAVAGARVEVSRFIEWNIEGTTLVKLIGKIVDEPVRPLDEPHAYLLAESLAAKGLVYPKLSAKGVVARDPHGLFKAAVKEASSRGLGFLADLDPSSVLARMAEAGVELSQDQG